MRPLHGGMVGKHHHFNGLELGQTLGDGEGQGGLVFFSPWGQRGSDMMQQLNHNKCYSKKNQREGKNSCELKSRTASIENTIISLEYKAEQNKKGGK